MLGVLVFAGDKVVDKAVVRPDIGADALIVPHRCVVLGYVLWTWRSEWRMSTARPEPLQMARMSVEANMIAVIRAQCRNPF